MIQDKDLRGYLNNRVPSRENCERVRAAGIVADDIWVQELADTLLDIRQAVRGGSLNPSAPHWKEPNVSDTTTITHNQVREIADLVGVDIPTMLMILDELRNLRE